MPKSRPPLDENQIVELMRAGGYPPGDDVALLNKKTLFTSDSLVEDVHFDWRYCSPADVAAKLVAVNVSDIFCKGGRPLHALLNVGLSPRFARERSDVVKFSRSLHRELKKYKVSLLGGDTTRAAKCFFSLSLVGEVDSAKHFVPRKNQRIRKGDQLVLAGQVGGSSYALKRLQAGSPVSKKIKSFYCAPKPQPRAPRWLSALKARASIDQSDSLHESLLHLATANKLNMHVEVDQVPTVALLRSMGWPEKLPHLLGGGEDLAVLAIIPGRVSAKEIAKYSLHLIGKVTDLNTAAVEYSIDGERIDYPGDGSSIFRHF